MSIATEITRLQTLRNKLRTKLVTLGLVASTADLEESVDAVDGITDRAAVSITLDPAVPTYTVPAGYHNGAGAVQIVPEEKSATPSAIEQSITPTPGKVLAKVTVAPAPTEERRITANGTYTPQAGNVGFSEVTVDVGSAPVLQAKSVTPTKSAQSITPDGGYDGLSQVDVAAIPANYADISDVTATAPDVLANRIFVDAGGNEIAGTMPNNGAVAGSIDGLTVMSFAIPAGYHSGAGSVSLTGDIEAALAAI